MPLQTRKIRAVEHIPARPRYPRIHAKSGQLEISFRGYAFAALRPECEYDSGKSPPVQRADVALVRFRVRIRKIRKIEFLGAYEDIHHIQVWQKFLPVGIRVETNLSARLVRDTGSV
jgi:hypothetical protein